MQVTEVARVMEREDAAGAVFFPFVRTGCSGEQNPHLGCSIGFTNDVVTRGNTDTTFNRQEKDIQIVRLRAQPFQFQAKWHVTSAISKQAPTFPRMGNPLMKLVAQFMNILTAMHTAVYCFRCNDAVAGAIRMAPAFWANPARERRANLSDAEQPIPLH
jgi:hypothetical protein